ncbi:MAG: SulP family inorganic anion transporter [Planctomycetia bacterium]|nr:SulP family inorganic anion transporter [Planctomycetia bacterium]
MSIVSESSPSAIKTPKPNLRADILSGFLVFLIAMPLCLGIAKASEYPPIAGIWTAVIGGLLTTFLSNSQLTIKGPAAGLIVVVATSVVSLGEYALPKLPEEEIARLEASGKSEQEIQKELQVRQIRMGYPLALGCAVIAGVIQTLLGLFKGGNLGELVPLTPVHGMLASIGITIMAKSLFPMLGMPAAPSSWTPLELIRHLLGFGPDPSLVPPLTQINLTVAAVGFLSLVILIAFPYLKVLVKPLAAVPAQVFVLAVAIPLGLVLNLEGVGKSAGLTTMVSVPNIIYSDNPLNALRGAFTFPDFSAVLSLPGLVAVLMFCLIASIESLLSSQAIDLIDPWKRKTDQNRDLMATGIANTLCGLVGALPMISEIVRSKANIDNGACTKYANFFHGLFLLAFVLLLPMVINIIPLAALGAMLVFVGFRLASPKEFFHTFQIGIEQLLVFITTIIVTLSTDLLIGVFSGIALKAVIHLIFGAPVRSFWMADVVIAERNGDVPVTISVRGAALFSNWLGVRKAIDRASEDSSEVILDVSETKVVDHSTMEKLHCLQEEFLQQSKKLTLVGLENHRPLSNHPTAARHNLKKS